MEFSAKDDQMKEKFRLIIIQIMLVKLGYAFNSRKRQEFQRIIPLSVGS